MCYHSGCGRPSSTPGTTCFTGQSADHRTQPVATSEKSHQFQRNLCVCIFEAKIITGSLCITNVISIRRFFQIKNYCLCEMSIPGFLKCIFNVFILRTLRALNKRLSNYYIMLTNMSNPSLPWQQAKLVKQDWCGMIITEIFQPQAGWDDI